MSITIFQRDLCRIIAANRRGSGESYIAGGVALNTFLNAPRVSFDIDLFHDTEEALQATWANDRALLSSQGYEIQVLREARAYVEVIAA